MKIQLGCGILKSFYSFCSSTSLGGYKYVIDKNRSAGERTIWIFINLALLIGTVLLTINLWNILMENPTITSLQRSNLPVSQVPFPGISICNINKISKKKTKDFVKIIMNSSEDNFANLMRKFRILGNMYDYDSFETENTITFQKLLDELHEKYPQKFTMKTILQLLTIPCEEFLQNCTWGGKDVKCSDIFELRLTFEGYCCLFNYMREHDSFSELNRVGNNIIEEHLYQQAGFENGLSVTAINDPDDYYYSILATMGVKIHVFNGRDYPDVTSGSLTEHVLAIGKEGYISLQPRLFKSTSRVRRYPVEKRRCIFTNEQTIISQDYTESDCLVACRMESMMALCQCTPFTIPISEDKNICSLIDSLCLQKYKDKWLSLAPSDLVGHDILLKEKHIGLQCQSRCYPNCEYVLYDVHVNAVPIIKQYGKQAENYTNIHIYFRNHFAKLYVQDATYYWFEIVGNLGGVIGLMLGFSIISLIEILIHITYKLFIFSVKQKTVK